MKIKLNYLDTTIESIERLKEARENINKAIFIDFIVFVFSFFFSFFLFFIVNQMIGIYFVVLSAMYVITIIGLILKREIYGIMIYLKAYED